MDGGLGFLIRIQQENGKTLKSQKKSGQLLSENFSSEFERILCDRAWTNEALVPFGDRKLIVSGHNKPKGKDLTPWQLAENEILGHYRGKNFFFFFFKHKLFNLFLFRSN